MRYAMIMAGGSGTRLWPMSRRARPKQLLPFIDGKSLLELAASRLDGAVPIERQYICTGQAHRDAVLERLPDLAERQILCEPEGRDTVNAIGYTAVVLSKTDPDAVFAALTADHVIEPADEFRRKLDLAFSLVEDDPHRMVTFSIMPTAPATNYGYVERGEAIEGYQGAYLACTFKEKPDPETAKNYVAAGTYAWNSGMFVFSAGGFLEALSQFKPRSYQGVMRIGEAWGTARQDQVLKEVYPTLPKISVDYAVMEAAVRDEQFTVCTVPMAVWWMDVGSWPTYGETLHTDEHNNGTNTKFAQLDSRNVLAISDDDSHTIATVGCDDLIIVHTEDVTLVCPRDEAERIKQLTEIIDDTLK